MYLYVRVDIYDEIARLILNKNKTARLAGRRREHSRGRPRQSRESKVKQDEQAAQQVVDLISIELLIAR